MSLVTGAAAAVLIAFVAIAVGRLLFEVGVLLMIVAVCTLVGTLLRVIYHHGHDT